LVHALQYAIGMTRTDGTGDGDEDEDRDGNGDGNGNGNGDGNGGYSTAANGKNDNAPNGKNEAAVGSEGAAAGRVIECLIRIGGVDFVLVPATRRASAAELGGVSSRVANETKRRLWQARREAGLTQAQLAKRLGRSQAMISQAELGRTQVGERYVNQVLEACELRPGWGLPDQSSETPSGWDLDPRDVAGLDPETFEPVRRGSERDLELGRTFVWWDGHRSDRSDRSET
jgi:transcriptional regulator with XRE-family HTH domain